ncbi:MAG: alpha/beta hydrolase [Spirochaetaceae bacterium]|nr:alpha/beta hydrolase [Spirochaetaceae bacterium]
MIKCVKTNGFEMEYLQFGSGQKTLVIIPGLSIKSVLLSAESIESAYSCFTQDYTVYLFDRKKEVDRRYKVKQMARDTIAAIHALGLKDIYLFGTSQGGMICQFIAAFEPSLVKKMILASTTSSLKIDKGSAVTGWTDFAKKGDISSLVSSFVDLCYSKETAAACRAAAVEAHKDVTPEELKKFIVLSKGARGFSSERVLGRIKCPVFVIGTKADKVVGDGASERLAEKLGCKLFMYENYGHAVYDEAPDYKQRMMDFFAGE